MAFRFRLFVAALLVLAGLGCRKPLAPATSNAAPETWITAAPQDTITPRNESGVPTGLPQVGVISFRFHLYWAGADQDGEVRGFYWAVTETVPTPGLDDNPPLPAPKPQDFRYTARTDSTFIFNVFEESRSRRHAFYISAVDNEGRIDPTPARFIFDAFDRFPPFAVFTHSYGDGHYRDQREPGAPLRFRRFAIQDTFGRGRPAPRDTVPSGSRLLFRWRGQETLAGNPAVAFKYKFDTPGYITAEPGVDSLAVEPTRSGDGVQVFEVRAIDVAGGARTDQPTTRWFVVNYTPDSWFSGPDPSISGFTNDALIGGRYRNITNWNTLGPVASSYLHPDSIQVMPKDRPQRRSFFEIYGNRLFLRQEGDTVNMNSWVLFHGGGFDPDSPYDVRVDGLRFDTTSAPVLKRAGTVGSPVGFRIAVPIKLYPGGGIGNATLSQIFPLDEVLLSEEKHIGGYVGLRQSGRAYATLRAVDGDGRNDDRISSPVLFADSVDAGLITGPRAALRSRILTFHVNRAPYLQDWASTFEPGGPWNNKPITTYPDRNVSLGQSWALNARDTDPFDPTQASIGGWPPFSNPVVRLRYTVSVRGLSIAGNDTVWRPVLPTLYRSDVAPSLISIPSFFRGPDVTLELELCDFPTSDYVNGSGRCRNYSYPIRIPAAQPSAVAPLRVRDPRRAGPGNPKDSDGGLN